uniref:non-specific serine/threonine protein kinase n=1 Tax=Cyprinus carpio TaxID=7962 RepID=A0A8C1U4T0_CYPCA
MGLISRLKKIIEKECVQEPCVLLKITTNTAENHHPDEAPVAAGGFDGGEKTESEEKKKKKSFWRWPALCHIRNRYKIGPKLGQGGFGFVYEGTRCKDGLEPGHPEEVPMEIGLTLMASKSPQIIKLLDWEDNKDHYVMVMERPMPSMDLRSFVKRAGPDLVCHKVSSS